MNETSIDPITVEVIKGGLIYAAEEMGIALRNSAYSPNIKERMDFSCAIFDTGARLVAQAEHIPVHLGSMQFAVRNGLDEHNDKLEDGDMLFFNDPYISGTHLPDLTLVSPICSDGEIIGYSANKAHHSDVGGAAPGSMVGDATEIFQEGIIIPPVRLVKNGLIDKEIAKVLLGNVRTPYVTLGDIRAQVAANILGRRRILELAEKFGVNTLHKAIEEILDYSEKRMRLEIRKMPKGVFSAEDHLESTGTSQKRVRIRATITIKGNRLLIDYSGTDRQVDGPVNAVLGVTLSGVYYTIRCLTDSTIPMNEGCYRPVTVRVPEGTVMNPIASVPVAGGNVETSQRNVDVLLKAFSKLLPERVCAACQGTMNNVAVGGLDPERRTRWTFYETIAGGFGGRKGQDGPDGLHSHMTNTMNTPIEVIEAVYPIRFLRYEFREDSGGAGKWRGGVGLERSWMLLGSLATLSVLAERTKMPPYGLYGGKPGAKGEYFVVKKNGRKKKLDAKSTVEISRGEVLIVRTPGGGGYGDPLERDRVLIQRDLTNGLISLKTVEQEYGENSASPK